MCKEEGTVTDEERQGRQIILDQVVLSRVIYDFFKREVFRTESFDREKTSGPSGGDLQILT